MDLESRINRTILGTISNEKWRLEDEFPMEDVIKNNLKWETLVALQMQIISTNLRERTSGVSKKAHYKQIQGYLNRFRNNEGTLLEIAKKVSFSPYILCRELISNVFVPRDCPNGKKGKIVTAILKDRQSKIADVNLRKQIDECLAYDKFFSFENDRVRRNWGLEYEYKLKKELFYLGIPFESENTLRERGWLGWGQWILLLLLNFPPLFFCLL